jgi:hypothetical protein
VIDLIFGVLTPLSAIFQLLLSWQPVLVVEEVGVPSITGVYVHKQSDSNT